MVSEEPWKEKKYWIHWRSSLESYLPAYFCTLTLWRGTASSFIFLGFVLVWFHLGIWKHGSPQMLKCLWHLRVNFFNCSERKSKTGKKKKKRAFSFSSCLPSDSTWQSLEEVFIPGAARQSCCLRNTATEFSRKGEDKRSEAIWNISQWEKT